jgi:S-(hydroxymethyl)glutathione dehydrogenase / alcohol dehydrogenase
MKSTALVLRAPGAPLALETVEVGEPGPGEVLVRLMASGVCGSDNHVVHGRSGIARMPTVLGHEGAGVVQAVGPGVTELEAGDHVVLGLYVPCGSCRQCRAGRFQHCSGEARRRNTQGIRADGTTRFSVSGEPLYPLMGLGSLSEFTNVPAAQAIAIDRSLDLAAMCLTGCGVTTGFGAAVNTAGVGPGDSVLVVGCGGVGLNVVQGARIAGATRIIAVDPQAGKRELALELGATHVVDPGREDLATAVDRHAPGGVDWAFEVVGSVELAARCLALTRIGGTCVMVGAPPPGSAVAASREALMGERRLVGCRGGSNIPARDIPRLADLYAGGQLKLEPLIGKRLRLEEFAEAFAALDTGEVARSVITFDSATA